jgi:hypothetical protein
LEVLSLNLGKELGGIGWAREVEVIFTRDPVKAWLQPALKESIRFLLRCRVR